MAEHVDKKQRVLDVGSPRSSDSGTTAYASSQHLSGTGGTPQVALDTMKDNLSAFGLDVSHIEKGPGQQKDSLFQAVQNKQKMDEYIEEQDKLQKARDTLRIYLDSPLGKSLAITLFLKARHSVQQVDPGGDGEFYKRLDKSKGDKTITLLLRRAFKLHAEGFRTDADLMLEECAKFIREVEDHLGPAEEYIELERITYLVNCSVHPLKSTQELRELMQDAQVGPLRSGGIKVHASLSKMESCVLQHLQREERRRQPHAVSAQASGAGP